MRSFAVTVALLLCGCAGMRVLDVSDPEADREARGVRYYMASPYLLVTANDDGSVATEVVHLPDPHKKFSAQPFNTLATNNTTLEFDKGVIKSGESEVDSAAVPKAVLSALEKVALAYIGAIRVSEMPDGGASIPLPQIFKIASDSSGFYLIGPEGRIATPGAVTIRPNEVK